MASSAPPPDTGVPRTPEPSGAADRPRVGGRLGKSSPEIVRRFASAVGIGLVCGLAGYLSRAGNDVFTGSGDFYWALYTAESLVQGRDPYAFAPTGFTVPYPLPAALFGLPLLALPWPVASAIFTAISTGLLAFVCTRHGEWWRLWIFGSLPMYAAVLYAQWTPLILVGWFVPALAPLLVLVKPQIALPVALRRWSWPGVSLAGAVFALALVVYPSWPRRWMGMLGEYQLMFPVLTLPFGPLLLAAALLWRTETGRLLLGMSVLPFRSSYDLCALWLIPRTHRQMLSLTVLSWVALFAVTGAGRGHAAVVPLLFMPSLCMLFLQHRGRKPSVQTILH